MFPKQFFWQHWRAPLIAFALLAPLLATSSLDIAIAHQWFFDATRGWIGADSWWTNELIHDGGRWLIRGVVLAALIAWLLSFRQPRLREWRRPLGYFIVATVLSIGLVGLLKTLTNVDCPRDLLEFGGTAPFVHLFADRPDLLPHARCFPAAHASSGYALLALYFALYEHSRVGARLGLALGVAMGLIFGIAQQARGAHFVSHDVWSAFLVWTVSLTLYTYAFKARLWNLALPTVDQAPDEASVASYRLPAGGTTDLP